jgi:hypothetical protein
VPREFPSRLNRKLSNWAKKIVNRSKNLMGVSYYREQ